MGDVIVQPLPFFCTKAVHVIESEQLQNKVGLSILPFYRVDKIFLKMDVGVDLSLGYDWNSTFKSKHGSFSCILKGQ